MDLQGGMIDANVPSSGVRAGAGASGEAALWQRLREDRDVAAREALLDMHLPYAKVVAASYYAKRMHDEIEFADYLQLSSLGLIEALDRFDPQVGVLFKTFAARRMHGAILDGLERLTEKQQQIAARQRLEAQRRAAIRDAADRQDKPGTRQRSPDQVLQFVAEAGLAFALAWILDGTGMVQTSEKSETLPFYRSVELKQLRERIIEMVRALPPQERRVIQSHYFQEIAFEEIAGTMGLTRGRISQIHKQGLLRLKELLRNHFECDVSW